MDLIKHHLKKQIECFKNEHFKKAQTHNLRIQEVIKIYDQVEFKDDRARTKAIEHNKKINCYAAETNCIAEEQIQEVSNAGYRA